MDLQKIETTVTTRLLNSKGEAFTEITRTATESGGNPTFVGRAVTRTAESTADDIRVALGAVYGEAEAAWRRSA